MSPYIHLGRYAKPGSHGGGAPPVAIVGDTSVHVGGRIWNLRTGDKSGFVPGFNYAPDGRFMKYGDTQNEVVYPDGRVVAIGPTKALHEFQFVGPYMIVGDEYGKPFRVLDADGNEQGRLAQKSDNPAVFNPHDGKTLWLNEEKFIAQHDIASRKVVRKIEAAKSFSFVCPVVLSSGHVVTFERGKQDRLVVFDPTDKRVGEREQGGMSIAPLGDRFVVSDFAQKQFHVYDTKLELVQSVPMFEPGRDGHNTAVGMPSGREWIAVGGRGEWDHYGERAKKSAAKLAPKAKPTTKAKPAAKSKTAAKPKRKSPAVKPAKKSAAKR